MVLFVLIVWVICCIVFGVCVVLYVSVCGSMIVWVGVCGRLKLLLSVW